MATLSSKKIKGRLIGYQISGQKERQTNCMAGEAIKSKIKGNLPG